MNRTQTKFRQRVKLQSTLFLRNENVIQASKENCFYGNCSDENHDGMEDLIFSITGKTKPEKLL